MSSAKEEYEEHEDVSAREDTRIDQNDYMTYTSVVEPADNDVADDSAADDMPTYFQHDAKIADGSVTEGNLDMYSFGAAGSETTEYAQEAHVVRSSSYENIYVGTKLPGEESQEYCDVLEISAVGEPRYAGHEEPHLTKRIDGKSSSFENLYESIQMKETTCVEEKDVDERGDDEPDRYEPEKGEHYEEKEDVDEGGYDRPVTAGRPSVTFGNDALLFPSSPIDITLESGLDKIGHGKSEASPLLQHSLSYDTDTDTPIKKTRRSSTGSTPDEIDLAAPRVEKSVAAESKGTFGCEYNNPFRN
jgi:hypothetical protein